MVLTVKQMAAIKRVAQTVAPYTVKKAKLQEQIRKAAEQIKQLDDAMEAFQVPVRGMTGGLTSEAIIMRTTINGAAKYEPNPSVVRFNEASRVYEFITEEAPVVAVEPSMEEAVEAEAVPEAGNPFDNED